MGALAIHKYFIGVIIYWVLVQYCRIDGDIIIQPSMKI